MAVDCAWCGMENVGQQMEFLRLFKLLNVIFREEIDRHLKELELTTSQLDVIVGIAGHRGEPVSQRDIEEELRLSNPTVTGILKRLEKKGFVTRTVNPQDRRYREVKLTAKCAQLGEKIHPSAQELLGRTFRGFTREEFETLNRLLKKLLENGGGKKV